MKKWQKYWLYFIVTVAVLHFIRDISQDLGINNFLSTVFIKQNKANFLAHYTWYWWVFNTYVWELSELTITVRCFRKRHFGLLGFISIALFTIVFSSWLYYWFVI